VSANLEQAAHRLAGVVMVFHDQHVARLHRVTVRGRPDHRNP
jgi:hypothetical protein